MKRILAPLLLCVTSFSYVVHAEERLDLDGATITGNQALPKVLYIVPWQDSSAAPDDELLPGLADENPAVIDRDVFRRQIQYFDALHGNP